MHPTILGSVQRRATLERVHASSRPFSTNALLHPSYIRVLYIYICICARIYRALRVCTSTDRLSRTILPIDAALPHPLRPLVAWLNLLRGGFYFAPWKPEPIRSRSTNSAAPKVTFRYWTVRRDFFQLAKRLSPVQVLLFFSCPPLIASAHRNIGMLSLKNLSSLRMVTIFQKFLRRRLKKLTNKHLVLTISLSLKISPIYWR